jgi:ribonuclease HII
MPKSRLVSSQPHLQVETRFWQAGNLKLVGVDEVGRGCLAGPVVAAAVLLPVNCKILPGVQDSKQVPKRQRAQLDWQIRQQALAVGIGAASVAEINQLNILWATYLAMYRALSRIGDYDHALIDGRPLPGNNPQKQSQNQRLQTYLKTQTALTELVIPNPLPHTAIVGGDASSYAIACASIVAKVRRDRFMGQLARRHPGYGWEQNVGYGTQQHLQALQTHGVTPAHRCHYAPIRQLLEQSPPGSLCP